MSLLNDHVEVSVTEISDNINNSLNSRGGKHLTAFKQWQEVNTPLDELSQMCLWGSMNHQ